MKQSHVDTAAAAIFRLSLAVMPETRFISVRTIPSRPRRQTVRTDAVASDT